MRTGSSQSISCEFKVSTPNSSHLAGMRQIARLSTLFSPDPCYFGWHCSGGLSIRKAK
jgi:hypothetical protein